jgi:hypothetical protein
LVTTGNDVDGMADVDTEEFSELTAGADDATDGDGDADGEEAEEAMLMEGDGEGDAGEEEKNAPNLALKEEGAEGAAGAGEAAAEAAGSFSQESR